MQASNLNTFSTSSASLDSQVVSSGCFPFRGSDRRRADSSSSMDFIPALGGQQWAVRPMDLSHSPFGGQRSGFRARLVDALHACGARAESAWSTLFHRHQPHFDTSTSGAAGQVSAVRPSLHEEDVFPADTSAQLQASVPSTGAEGTPATRAKVKAALLAKLGTMQSAGGLFVTLVAQEGSCSASPVYIADLPTSRFWNIPTAAATAVVAPDGLTVLAANRISLAGHDIAIASQYPMEKDLNAFLGMLAQERPSALVVLASEREIQFGQLPLYFSRAGVYGDLSASVRALDSVTEEGCTVMRYEMTLSRPGRDDVIIPVIHASEWADCSSLPVAQLRALGRMVPRPATQAGDAAMPADACGVPVIHCRAGVGRTGQLICSLALDQAPRLSLETVITQMRLQRNAYMVQMDGQLNALVDLWLDDERAVFATDEQAMNAAANVAATAATLPAVTVTANNAGAAAAATLQASRMFSEAADAVSETSTAGIVRVARSGDAPPDKVRPSKRERRRHMRHPSNNAVPARARSAPPGVTTS